MIFIYRVSGYRKALRRKAEGFTLLELLVALSIGVALIVASGTIIKSSVGLMARGEHWLQGDFREASALEFWREQVSAIRNDGYTNTLFLGRQGELSFVSAVTLNIQGKALVEAHYSIQREKENNYNLVYKEKRLVPSKVTQEKEGKDLKGIIFLRGYDRIGFEYLEEAKDKDNSSPWKAEWKADKGIPRAIRLTLVREQKQKALIAPIVVTSFSSSSGQ